MEGFDTPSKPQLTYAFKEHGRRKEKVIRNEYLQVSQISMEGHHYNHYKLLDIFSRVCLILPMVLLASPWSLLTGDWCVPVSCAVPALLHGRVHPIRCSRVRF